MACASQRWRVTRSVWSNKSTTAHYHSFLRLPVGRWGRVRVSLVVEGSSSANLVASTAGVYGDVEDDFASGSPVDLPSTPTSQSGDGTAWGASFANLDASRQQLDIGVNVKNASGTQLEAARVTLIIDAAE